MPSAVAQQAQIKVTAIDDAGNRVSKARPWPVEGEPPVVKPWNYII